MKKCWKCQETKPLAEFGSDKNRFDLKSPKCKPCVRLACAEYRINNPEKRKATCAKYRANNAEKCRESVNKWHAKDPVRADGVRRAWADANHEKVLAYKATWRAANYDKSSAIKASRSAAPGSHTGDDIKKLLILQRNKCAYCKSSLKAGYHKDHIVPLKLLGTNSIENIQMLCPLCNLSKGSKHPIDYANKNGRLL
jgi:hypothetical protein